MRGEESQGGREPHLGKREGSEREHGDEDALHSEERHIPMRKGMASKTSLPRRGRRKHERVSACKSSPGRSAESWFHSKSGQT